MNLTIFPGKLTGNIQAIASKSQAHRLLICAAFSDKTTELICSQVNEDIEATADCLRAIGTSIARTEDGYRIAPAIHFPQAAVLPCRESGSTLRFMLPIIGALGIDTTFQMAGRLPQRPLSPLWAEMERMGCSLTRPDKDTLRCSGQLCPGTYNIRGDVSSQFVTGLLFAMALMDGDSQLNITSPLQSRPYVDMTTSALSAFGVSANGFTVCGSYPFRSPGTMVVEGDWSNAAFFFAAKELGNNIEIGNLNYASAQGDKAVTTLVDELKNHCTISAADIPDLIPILSVVAAANKGAVFTDVGRLRIKESNRVDAIMNMLKAFGISSEATESTLTIYPGQFQGGTVDSVNDHRIAMSAAIAATAASEPVTILNAQCVAKSYPSFWQEYSRLGGNYEQHIR